MSSAVLFQQQYEYGTSRPRGGDGPTCDNRPDRPSLRSGTAVPPLNWLPKLGEQTQQSLDSRSSSDLARVHTHTLN
jgi:hypothetical protein